MKTCTHTRKIRNISQKKSKSTGRSKIWWWVVGNYGVDRLSKDIHSKNVNTGYRAINHRLDQMNLGISRTKDSDNCTSFKIHNISNILNNNVNEHMV